ncbi:MAG: hypothetical protein HC840_05895 [Leptolyngbyaceae cyanobacterium RM2_2_4]|nr:hypothetical protein [Leptolyngbyaceae cyanobacterium RM2_2_4]
MSSFPLQTVILPAVLISSAVFSTLTLPFVLLKEPIAIDIPPLLSGGRIEPMFDAENKDVAIRYVGVAILLSVAAGIGTVEFLRARHSAEELTQTKNQLSSLKLSLQEKSGSVEGSRSLNLEDGETSEHEEEDAFEGDLDGQEADSLTLTFDQYVAAESLGQNVDAVPLVLSGQLLESDADSGFADSKLTEQAIAPPSEPIDLPSSPLKEAQQDIWQKPVQNGHAADLSASLRVDDGVQLEETQTDADSIGLTSFNGIPTYPPQHDAVTSRVTGYLPSPGGEDLKPIDRDSTLPGVPILNSREQYQTCRVRVPHLKSRLFAVLVQGKYYSLFRSGVAQERALETAVKLEHRGDEPIITQTNKGYTVWVWQPKAIVDDVIA